MTHSRSPWLLPASLLAVALLSSSQVSAQTCDAEKASQLAADGDYQVMVVDIDLPEKMGPKVAWSFRENGQQIPIIGLQSMDGDWDRDDLKDLGFDLVLIKPVETLQLVESILSLIEPREAGGTAKSVHQAV